MKTQTRTKTMKKSKMSMARRGKRGLDLGDLKGVRGGQATFDPWAPITDPPESDAVPPGTPVGPSPHAPFMD